MRVAFCGGGTGGHVYPALTVAAALRREAERQGTPLELLYIGVRGKIDAELVAREGIPFRAVAAGPLRSRSVAGTASGMFKLMAGFVQSLRLLRGFRPDAVFATGGYGSVGVGLAAKALGLPLLLFLPDVEAGLAVKALVRVASRIAVTVAPALAAMPAHKTSLTGYPVRPGFFGVDRVAARRALGLQPDLPVLLVTGGSTGASRINRAVASRLPDYLANGQLLHVSGQNDYDWLVTQRAALAQDLQSRYQLYPYLHDEMAPALGAADLAVMRAGASTLGELPAARLPAILVPGDFSDQDDNARYLEGEGAAVVLSEARLDSLFDTIAALTTDHARMDRMRTNLERLAQPEAAEHLAGVLMDLAGVRPRVAA